MTRVEDGDNHDVTDITATCLSKGERAKMYDDSIEDSYSRIYIARADNTIYSDQL